MNEAIKLTHDLQRGEKEPPKSLEGLKGEINNMLWMYLPDDITIGQADILAMVINEIVVDPRRFLLKQEEK